MKQQTFNQTVGMIMGIVALLHLFRAIIGWDLAVEGYNISAWISWLAAVIIGFLSYTAFSLKPR